MSLARNVGAGVLTVALSATGLNAIMQHEGLGQPGASIQKAYPDPYYGWKVGTICYGHTKGVTKGSTATMEQCKQYLQEDTAKHCKIVYDALLPTGILLTQGEQDAYCSFAYNLGQFKNTPSVYGRLIQGDHYGACAGLLKYTYSNGKYSQGLANRRASEYKLCISNLANKE